MPSLPCTSFIFYWQDIRLGLAQVAAVFFLLSTPCVGQVPSPLPSSRPEPTPQTQTLTQMSGPLSRFPSPIDSSIKSSKTQAETEPKIQPPSANPKKSAPAQVNTRIPKARKPAQETTPLSISSVQTHIGILMPAGDMAERFGVAGQVGLEFGRIARGKWLVGGSFTHLFSNSVRERDIFSNIATESGDVITRDGVFEDYRLRMFGWLMSARIGRLIAIDPTRPNRGLSLELGVGVMQHKIKIETPVLNSPQLSADYKRGYDRLSNGLCLSPALGYLHYAPNRRINYFIRLEGHVAQTRNRRTVNYDTGLPDHRLRRDALWGFRAGWILPLYRRAEKEVNFF